MIADSDRCEEEETMSKDYEVKTLSSSTRTAIVVVLWVVLLTSFGSCVWASSTGRLDANYGWCCAKPRDYCRDVTICTNAGAHVCLEWENTQRCVRLCDEWQKFAGARGGGCPPPKRTFTAEP